MSHEMNMMAINVMFGRWECLIPPVALHRVGASIMHRTLCNKMYICSIVDISDERTVQSMRTTLFWRKKFG